MTQLLYSYPGFLRWRHEHTPASKLPQSIRSNCNEQWAAYDIGGWNEGDTGQSRSDTVVDKHTCVKLCSSSEMVVIHKDLDA